MTVVGEGQGLQILCGDRDTVEFRHAGQSGTDPTRCRIEAVGVASDRGHRTGRVWAAGGLLWWAGGVTTAETLELGRGAIEGRRWSDAYVRLSAADRESALEPGDLERLATTAYLIGRDAESAGLWERAHHELIRGGDEVGAARCAFWLAVVLLNGGEPARGGGWLARARRLLGDGRRDCPECGHLLVLAARQCVIEGDPAQGHALAAEAIAIGERFGDADVVTMARHIQGRALIREGKAAEGLGLLDEVMVAVTTGEISPIISGMIYCSLVEACQETFDLRRAGEWTAALTRWCESQPDLEPYRGQCLVHRSEIMQLHGAWADAMTEVRRACERFLRRPADPAAGAAFYQQGELHRLYGDAVEAERAYRLAS